METENKDQVDSPVEGQEEHKELSEAEQKKQVKTLLGTETVETEVAQEEIPVEAEVETPQPIVISDEIIEQFPSLRMFRGKNLTELAPVYDKLVRKYQNEIRERKELERKLEKSSLTELGEPPDQVEKPKEFKTWLENRDNLIREQAKSEIEPAPTMNPLTEVQKRLPKDVDINKVADEWAKFNARRLFDTTGQLKPQIKQMYQEDPDLMTDEIVSFYGLLSKAEQNEMAIETRAKEESYKKTKDAFKKARETKEESSQINSVSRTNEITPEDELLTQIYQKAFSG